MDLEKRSLRVGAAVLGCALLFRLLCGSGFATVVQALSQPEVASFLLYMETGRVLRLSEPQATAPPEETENAVPETTLPEPEKAVFSQEDAALVSVRDYTGYDPDTAALLQTPLTWDLTQEGPAVLILHTHATESYENTEGYEASGSYRTLDEHYNTVSIGERVAQLLEQQGISVIHDRALHDYPSYNGSYDHARAAIADYLEQFPSIRLILDLHRDAASDGNGNQVRLAVSTDRGEAAQLMLVVGTDAGGLKHPDWQENMALAVKLQAQLELLHRGLCRPICLRSQRFNQDLRPGGLLIEVGTAGNTRQEALLAAEYLAESIIALSRGTALQ